MRKEKGEKEMEIDAHLGDLENRRPDLVRDRGRNVVWLYHHTARVSHSIHERIN